jgi:hypothetical protein
MFSDMLVISYVALPNGLHAIWVVREKSDDRERLHLLFCNGFRVERITHLMT